MVKLKWGEISRLVVDRGQLASRYDFGSLLQEEYSRLLQEKAVALEAGRLYLFVLPLSPEANLLARVLTTERPQDRLVKCARSCPVQFDLPDGNPPFGFRGWERISTGWRSVASITDASGLDGGRVRISHDGRAMLFYNQVAPSVPMQVPGRKLVMCDQLLRNVTIQALSILGHLYQDAGYVNQLIWLGAVVQGLQGGFVTSQTARQAGRVFRAIPFDEDYSRVVVVRSAELAQDPVDVTRLLLEVLISQVTYNRVTL